jgi:hypothetical protein
VSLDDSGALVESEEKRMTEELLAEGVLRGAKARE